MNKEVLAVVRGVGGGSVYCTRRAILLRTTATWHAGFLNRTTEEDGIPAAALVDMSVVVPD